MTFEEAANLQSFVQAPARLPDHADVNGNPVYKQFMRLTHIYEEGELHRRQGGLRALAAERLGRGFRPPRPPTPAPMPPAPPGPRPRPSLLPRFGDDDATTEPAESVGEARSA